MQVLHPFGSALVKAIAEIYGAPLTLKCLIKNTNGMAFYRAAGWTKVGDGTSDEGDYALLRYTFTPEG